MTLQPANRNFFKFCIFFLLIFCGLYGGTILLIGVSSPGNYYAPVIDQYFNYVDWLKLSLQTGVINIMSLFNIPTTTSPNFQVNITNGRGIIINNSCAGYGVYSFWIAYILANQGNRLQKTYWLAGGLFLLWFINVLRITLFLYTINRSQRMPFGIDHHTWFNIAAYLCIFIMMYFFENRKDSGQNDADATVTKSESEMSAVKLNHE